MALATCNCTTTTSTATSLRTVSKFGRNQITIKNHTNINSRNCKGLQPKA